MGRLLIIAYILTGCAPVHHATCTCVSTVVSVPRLA